MFTYDAQTMRLLFLLFIFPLFAKETPIEEIAAFRAEEELIAGLVSPLTGQLIQKNIDLVVHGNESLDFSHSYLPYQIQACGPRFEQFCHPWMFVPHLFAAEENKTLFLTNENGHTLPYFIKKGKLSLQTSSIKHTNTDGHEVGAHFDPHNVYYEKSQDGSFCVWAPDGTKRFYKSLADGVNFRLYSETRPNGKHIRYLYNARNELTSIEARDPSGNCVYAKISLSRTEDEATCFAHGSDGKKVSYHTQKIVSYKNEQHGIYHSLSRLVGVSSPLYPQEIIGYNSLIFSGQSGRGQDFYFTYGKDAKIASLYVRTEGHKYSLYTFSYEPQKTVVIYPEGTKREHLFNANFQPEKVSFYDRDGTLRREKRYIWEENGRLKTLEEVGISRTEYTTDEFGSPILETLVGDLEGYGREDTYTVKRTYSGKDPAAWFLLLTEETPESITNYSYVPRTNLLLSKTVQGKDGLLLKENRKYDNYFNLIAIVTEAAGETKITRIYPKQNYPALHQPEWVEELYVENGEEKLLKKTHFFYNDHNLVSKEDIYDANGICAYSLEKEYSSADLLLSETNALGQRAYYSYDKDNRLVSSIPFSEKLKETMTYDAKGRLTSRSVGEHTTYYEYDRDDNLILEINPLGQKTHYVYDLVAKKPQEILLGESKRSFTYDGYGRTLSETDALGNTTSYTYTAHGKPRIVLYPDGTQESFLYYTNGLVKEHTDRGGLITYFAYDSFGRMISKQYAEGEERWSYNALHLISYADRAGYTTHYTYDGAGRLVKEEKCGRIISYTYDSLGGLASTIQGGVVTGIERDFLGRVVLETKNGIPTKNIVYDAEGNECEVIAGERKESFFYDAHRRLIKHQGPLGETTHISYLEDKVLEKITVDPSGLHVVEIFDIYDRMVEKRLEKDGILSRERFTYDLVGNLLTHKEDVFEGTIYTKSLTRSYAYDACNRCISRANSKRTTTYTYTPQGKVATKKKHDGTLLTYTYTPLGDVETLKSSKGDICYAFSYDKCGRLLEGNGFKRKLDPFGNILEENFDGLVISKTYDDLDRVTSVILPGLSSITYDYDLYLRKVSYGNSVHNYDAYSISGELLQESGATYTRDLKGQILELKTPYFTQTCSYDLVGNVNYVGATCYTYDSLSQITSENDPIYTKNYNFNSHYDDGEQKERQEANDPLGKYDSLDRLIECKGYVYTYDALDRRLSKRKDSFFSAYYEHFLYDGFEEIACYKNNKSQAVKIGPPSRPAFFFLQNALTIPVYDAKGSLKYLMDPNTKEILNRYLFDAFGNPIEVMEKLDNPWRYALKHYDPESSLIYFGKRYYNPSTKQWITEDPAGDIDTLNLYAFVRNNPLRYVDYAGLLAEERWSRFNWMANGVYNTLNTPYMQGSLQACAGFAEFSCGSALMLSSGGLGGALGWSMMAHGADHFFTGIKTAFLGEKNSTATSYLLQEMGLSSSSADFFDSAFSLGGMACGSRLFNQSYNCFLKKPLQTFTEITVNRPATSSVSAQLLKNKLISEQIAGGHAFEKHVINRKEFLDSIVTRKEFARHIEKILNKPTEIKALTCNRIGYWDQKSGTVIIRDPLQRDGGTAFKPLRGKTYYDEVLK